MAATSSCTSAATKIKVKQEVSVRTYQAHADTYVQDSQTRSCNRLHRSPPEKPKNLQVQEGNILRSRLYAYVFASGGGVPRSTRTIQRYEQNNTKASVRYRCGQKYQPTNQPALPRRKDSAKDRRQLKGKRKKRKRKKIWDRKGQKNTVRASPKSDSKKH